MRKALLRFFSSAFGIYIEICRLEIYNRITMKRRRSA
jgi:hypothetical protein